ncbi:MAG: hypothetical protein QFB86_00740 [Patescibacteria group bacterium]|nr:hypothetical protein [Patescibacteria group bacterium]
MIDTVLSKAFQRYEPEHMPGFEPQDSIVEVISCDVKNSNTLTIVFPPWHASNSLSKILQARLAFNKSSSMLYNFDHRMLSYNAQMVADSFEYTADVIAAEIDKQQADFKNINLVGFSLGNVALSLVTARTQLFNNVAMVVPGATLAWPFMNGQRTQRMSDGYKEKGYTVKALNDGAWSNLAPAKHVEALVGHNLSVVLAQRDKYIPYESGQELVRAMWDVNLAPAVQVTNHGHVATVIEYSLGII